MMWTTARGKAGTVTDGWGFVPLHLQLHQHLVYPLGALQGRWVGAPAARTHAQMP